MRPLAGSLLASALMTGCGSTTIVSSPGLSPPDDSFFATVIVGAHLPEGEAPQFIRGVEITVNVGEDSKVAGVLRKEPKAEPFGDSWADYEQIAYSGYRIWHVAEPGPAVAYVSSVQSKVGRFGFHRYGYADSGGWQGPFLPIGYGKDTLPEPDDPNWTFLGCTARIAGPGVYYLGDFKIDGSVTETDASATVGIGSSRASLDKFLKRSGIDPTSVVDTSSSCKSRPGKPWFFWTGIWDGWEIHNPGSD